MLRLPASFKKAGKNVKRCKGRFYPEISLLNHTPFHEWSETKKGLIKNDHPLRGAEGIRTPVQTYSSKAFYMLISLLLVGNKPEMNKPIYCLAGWS